MIEHAPAARLEVVLPVYGAPAELRRCLDSLLRHTELTSHGVTLVVDGPQEPAVEEAIASALQSAPELRVLRSASRQGFVGSVNLGLEGTRGDVVLLNSDTEVTRDWLDKLSAAAASRPRVATVTPFSNHATICSLPRFLEENAVPAGHTVDSFAALVERVAEPAYPALPTGVGVCLYLRREALAAVGGFDAEGFGLGYGEEVDFCLRASRAGFVHLLDDATFIYHAGSRSFGTRRERRVRRAHRRIRRRYSEYFPAVARFIAEDPLRPCRERVLEALAPRRRGAAPAPPRVAHLVHGWPPWNHAGTELYACWLARRQARERPVAVYARIADPDRQLGEARELLDHGVRVRLAVNNFTSRDPLARNGLRARALEVDFARFLDQERPALLHVHHLAGHCASLLEVARRRGIPILYQVQDWWPACARVNLLHASGELCSGPGIGKCAECMPLTRRPPRSLWNRALHLARRRAMRRALRRAAGYVMGSHFIEGSYRDLGLLRSADRVWVLPYGIEEASFAAGGERRSEVPGLPLRFGFVGSLLPHKGAHVAVAAFQGIDPSRARLEVWGDSGASAEYFARLERLAGGAPVAFHPPFAEADKPSVLRALDVLLVPSLGLESFGLLAREALAAGVPVLASDRGALGELFAGEPCGALVEPGDPAAWRGWVERLVERPQQIAEWRRLAPAAKGIEEHWRELEEVYGELIGAEAATAAGRA